MVKRKTNNGTRGIVHAAVGQDKFTLSQFEPGLLLRPFVERYWVVRFALPPGAAHTQTVLSYPNVNLAFEHDRMGRHAWIYGIPSRPFVRELRGEGRVLGIKFRAGGFYPFWRQDIADLTGTTVAAAALLSSDTDRWMHDILDANDDAGMASRAESMLLARLPSRDEQAELAADIVRQVIEDREIIRVEQMSELSGLSIRQLQRLFRKYIGVTPKWIIKRFRLQEVAARLEQDAAVQWAELAVQYGYFDQAHLIKDFKSVLGKSPVEYRKQAASHREPDQ